MSTGPFYGKYRGVVVNNVDPMMIGRIQALVPDVSPIPGTWAMPCVPWAGINTGLFTVPPIGAGVWIEFEKGDPDYPVWVGGYWGTAAEVPLMARAVPPAVPGLTIQTTLKNGITTPLALKFAAACGYRHVHWSKAGFLGDELPSETYPNDVLLKNALRDIRDGDILVMHLGIRSRKDAWAPAVFEPLLEGLKARGFCFATLKGAP